MQARCTSAEWNFSLQFQTGSAVNGASKYNLHERTYLNSWLHRIPTKERKWRCQSQIFKHTRRQSTANRSSRQQRKTCQALILELSTQIMEQLAMMKEIRPDQHTTDDSKVLKNEWNPSKFINGPNAVFENVIEIKLSVENYKSKTTTRHLHLPFINYGRRRGSWGSSSQRKMGTSPAR